MRSRWTNPRDTNGNKSDHRSSIQIVADLLRAASDEDTKSCLFRRANLNHTRGERYIAFCKERELLDTSEDRYRVTREGREFLADWGQIRRFLVDVEADLDYR